jgi:periplasmic divalent cation tolerance protein
MKIILSSCKPEEAEMISDTLIKERLAASCSIIPNITAKVRWQGEAFTQMESLLIFRTRSELVWKLERRLVELNSFEVPEVASIDVQEWNEKYYRWVHKATEQPEE